jgi:Zn-dependent M28 family amino/carboxypeptidase
MTPFTQGANDNASGAAIVISLAQEIAQEPLTNFEVWALCTGCEEVGSYGAQEFIKRHKSELQGNYVINIDNVGGSGAGVCYTTTEGMIVPLKPSSELFSLANQIKADSPELNAYTLPFTTLNTDGSCFMINKIPTLSFVGLTPGSVIPNWHQVTDTFEHVENVSVENTESFVLKLLGRLDQENIAS